MRGLDIEERGGVFYLTGWLDETASLAGIEASARRPLKVNLEGLHGMNSTGTGTFLKFMRRAEELQIQLLECPSWFTDMANAIPEMLGKPAKASRIHTLFVPFACADCGRKSEGLVSLKSVKVNRNGVDLPTMLCEACRGPLKAAVDPQDYFVFLIESA